MNPRLLKAALDNVLHAPMLQRPPHPAELIANATPPDSMVHATSQLMADRARSNLDPHDVDWKPFPVTGAAPGAGAETPYKNVNPWLKTISSWVRSYMGLPGLDLQQVGDNPAFTSGWYGSQRTPNLIGPAAQAYAQRLGGGFSPGSPGFSNIMSQLPMLMGQPGAMSGYGLPGYGF